MKMVALIPARAGSKRVPGKNTRDLAGMPLMYWTMRAAADSGVFGGICISTDDTRMRWSGHRGINADILVRPPEFATDESPDIEWVRHALTTVTADAFAILRPTSPFRTAETIKRAYKQFRHAEAHSLRAVQPVKEHPGKMWQCAGQGYPIVPLIGRAWPPPGSEWVSLNTGNDQPWHSMPTQTLPKVYIQNASLEMAWSYVIPAFGTISGHKVVPFFTEGYEGFDINTEDDWREAERLIAEGTVALPALARV